MKERGRSEGGENRLKRHRRYFEKKAISLCHSHEITSYNEAQRKKIENRTEIESGQSTNRTNQDRDGWLFNTKGS